MSHIDRTDAAQCLAALLGRLQEHSERSSVHRLAAALGSAYVHDPWDAIPDSLPNGLLDDICFVRAVLETRRMLDGHALPSRHEHIIRAARSECRGIEPIMGRHVALLAAESVSEEQSRSAIDRLRQEARTALDGLGYPGEWGVDMLSVAPPTHELAGGTSVGIFGRTSSGKTTLTRRIIRACAPEYAHLAEALETDPRAHTTRVAMIIDLVPSLDRAWWFTVGASGHLGGMLEPTLNQSGNHGALMRVLAGGKDGGFAWAGVAIPSRLPRPLRVVDLPGTHGFASGGWSGVGRGVVLGLDAIVLPMDRRFFRVQECHDLLTALEITPSRQVALSLRWLDDSVKAPSPEWFRDVRVVQGIERNAGADAPSPEIWRRLKQVKVVCVARDAGKRDDLDALIEWATNVPSGSHKLPTYGAITSMAGFDRGPAVSGSRSEKAREALLLVGLLRAWHAALLSGGLE